MKCYARALKHKWGRAIGVAGPVAIGLAQTRPIAAGTVAAAYRLHKAALGGADTPTEGLTKRRASLLMATEDPTRRAADGPASADRRMERVVLAFLFDQHPTRLTVNELPFALDAKDFAEKDAIARAVRELAGVGLIRIDGDLVGPTRAALYFQALESE